jgi:tRNA pseudouridine38-40 synthase
MGSPEHPGSQRNLLLRMAYDGTDFFGWQAQPEKPTIQGTLAAALETICGQHVEVCGSGRTDAGVHASGQAASVRLSSPIPCDNLARALNRLLPESIRILSAKPVPGDFHARHDAISKMYRYRIFRGAICPPFLSRYVLPYAYPLDEAAMAKAAGCFQGTHDFRSFAASDDEDDSEEQSCVRTVFSSALVREREELVYTVEGSGFLHHMVRNIVGTLIEVGRGRTAAERIPEILAARRRSAAGPTAPARGLELVSVSYRAERLRRALND